MLRLPVDIRHQLVATANSFPKQIVVASASVAVELPDLIRIRQTMRLPATSLLPAPELPVASTLYVDVIELAKSLQGAHGDVTAEKYVKVAWKFAF